MGARTSTINTIICEEKKENKLNQELLDKFLYLFYDPNLVNNIISPNGESIINITIHSGQKFNLKFTKKLGEGSSGHVYKLEDNKMKVSIAVKFGKNDEETLIAEALNRSNCNVLRVKAIGKPIINSLDNSKLENFGYFMDLADGTLRNYVIRKVKSGEGITFEEMINIVETIRKQIVCIYELNNNYVYTDIKLENILYKCTRDNVVFILGDLGSAIPDARNRYLATYPPFEFKRGRFILDSENKKDNAMAWGLGILILSFIAGNKPEFEFLGYDKIIHCSNDQFITLYEILEKKVGNETASLINPLPHRRRSIFIPII